MRINQSEARDGLRVQKFKRETELQPHTSQKDASQNTMTFRYSP